MSDLEDPTEGFDAFGVILPLPYRLATVVTLGVWLWGVNLLVLQQHNIDTPSLIKYPSRSSHADPPHHLSVFRFAAGLSIPLAASIVLFWLLPQRTQTYGGLLPNATLLLFVLAFVVPARFLRPSYLWPAAGRSRLLSVLRRVSVGGLARTDDGKFGDVLMADALTSYARPLSEVYIVVCTAVTGRTARAYGHSVAVPFLLAAPFAMRFRQCLGDGQYANALKYATAFPAIALSVLMKSRGELLGRSVHSLWLVAALANALYSFYWDVYRDWDLDFKVPQLRRVRFFQPLQVYYVVIGVDLVLRFAWALKLSPHLEHYYDIEGGIFLLEILEAFRRFLWVFFRVEAEWIRTKHGGSSDLPLIDLGPKMDED